MRCFKPATKRFNAQKCQTNLKLAIARIRLLRYKKENELKILKREVAQCLRSGKVSIARIKVDLVFREGSTLEAYGIIESFCEKVASCLPVIVSQKSCPDDLQEAISSIVFASAECADLVELVEVRKQFEAKYGDDFIDAAMHRRAGSQVHFLVMKKLFAKTPENEMKANILIEIAKENNIEWDPTSVEEVSDPLDKKFVGHVMIPGEFPSIASHGPSKGLLVSGFSMGDSSTVTNPKAKDSTGSRDSEMTRNLNPDTSEAKRSSESRESVIANVRNPDISKALQSLEDEPRVAENAAGRRIAKLEALEELSFVDATEAAKAAAKSAERASIAAWAAVRLSNVHKISGSMKSNESVSSNRMLETLESIKGPPKKTGNQEEDLNHAETTSQMLELKSEYHIAEKGSDEARIKSESNGSGSSQSSMSYFDENSIFDTMQRTEKQSLKSVVVQHDNEQKPTRLRSEKHHQDPRTTCYSSGSSRSSVISDDESTVAGTPQTKKDPRYIPPPRDTPSKNSQKRKNVKGSVHRKGSISESASLHNITGSTYTYSKPDPNCDFSGRGSFEFSIFDTGGDPGEESIKPVSDDVDAVTYDESGSEGHLEFDISVPSDDYALTLDSHRYADSKKESLTTDGCGDLPYQNRNMKEMVPSSACAPLGPIFDKSTGSTVSSEEEMDERFCTKTSPSLLLANRTGQVGSPRRPRRESGISYKKKQLPISYNSNDSFTGKIESSGDSHWVVMDPSDMDSSDMQESTVKASAGVLRIWKSKHSSETYSEQVNAVDQHKAPTLTYTGDSERSIDPGSDSQVTLRSDSIKFLRDGDGGKVHQLCREGPPQVGSSRIAEDEHESSHPWKFLGSVLEEDREGLSRPRKTSHPEFRKRETKDSSLSDYSDTDEYSVRLDQNIKVTDGESSPKTVGSGNLQWKSKK